MVQTCCRCGILAKAQGPPVVNGVAIKTGCRVIWQEFGSSMVVLTQRNVGVLRLIKITAVRTPVLKQPGHPPCRCRPLRWSSGCCRIHADHSLQVSRSSLGVDQQATLPEAQETKANGAQSGDTMMDTEQPENSSDSDGDEVVSMAVAGDVVDGELLLPRIWAGRPPVGGVTPCNVEVFLLAGVAEERPEVLQCEFCGKTGYAHMFLRSKRFCSMTCVRRSAQKEKRFQNQSQ